MGVTVAHEPHARIHLPWRTIGVLLAAAVVAVVVLVLVNQPRETTSQIAPRSAVSTAGGASVVTAAVPKNESAVVRAIILGEMPATAPPEALAPLRKSSHTPWFAGGGR